MWTIMTCMLGGCLAGYLLRHRRAAWLRTVISVLVWALLFLLGVSIGGNDSLVSALSLIGWQALVIGALSTLGSVVAAWALWRVIRRRDAA